MRTTKTLWTCSGVLLCGLLLTGCNGQTKEPEREQVIKVKEMTAGGTDRQGDYNYSGTVEEENGTALSFSMGGTVTQLNVKVGDRVRRGQLIAAVDPSTVRNSYDMAHATRLQAEDAYRRMKQLHDKGSLPDIKWVEAESQLSQAVSAERIAKKNLADCRLYAAADGVVSEKYVEAGQNVAPGQPVVKVVTTKVLNVKVAVPEGEMARVQLHQQADIVVDALGGRTYRGQVVEKGVIADPVSRSYSVKIRVGGTDSQLLPGMVAKVSIAGMQTQQADGIVIPSRLLQLGDDNEYFVWVDEQGKAVRKTVVCGDFTAQGVTIVSGLQHGDKIISEGQQKVCNGTKVTVK